MNSAVLPRISKITAANMLALVKLLQDQRVDFSGMQRLIETPDMLGDLLWENIHDLWPDSLKGGPTNLNTEPISARQVGELARLLEERRIGNGGVGLLAVIAREIPTLLWQHHIGQWKPRQRFDYELTIDYALSATEYFQLAGLIPEHSKGLVLTKCGSEHERGAKKLTAALVRIPCRNKNSVGPER